MRAPESQIILAQECDFNLGGLLVIPSKLQVVFCSDLAVKGREVLQPRIMQVLVALARRRGEVVSRDEMMAVCWGGFAVSDDAINRCIARLRRLSETYGGFKLETIPRVGYQLNEDREAEAEPQTAPGMPAPMLSEAAITALLAPLPVPEVALPVAVTQTPTVSSWAGRQGIVAAISFAAGVLTSAAVFAGAYFL